MNGLELYIHYMKSSTISDFKDTYNLLEYYTESINEFEISISYHLKSDLIHIKKIFENIRINIENNKVPILDLLYNESLSDCEIIYALISNYGIPSIRSIDGTLHFPSGSKYEPSIDIVEILAQRIVLEKLSQKYSNSGTCSLIQICQLDDTNLIDDNCYGNQWKKESLCPFIVISKEWKLNEKIKVIQ